MQELTSIQHMQKIVLGILDHVTGLCGRHGLRYFLIRGTCIGAVRHHGFVPWDDDIDIAMPRQDYDRLAEIMLAEEHPIYKLLTLQDGTDYFYEFNKVTDTRTRLVEPGAKIEITGLGLFIDIFPLDGLGNDLEKAKKLFLNTQNSARKIASCANINKSLSADRIFIRCIRRCLYAMKSRKKSFEKVVDGVRKYSFDESAYVSSTFGRHGMDDLYEQGIFSGALQVPFEGRTVSIPSGYDAYLRKLYGDYMSMPPEEERKPHHYVKVFCEESLARELS